MAKIVNTKLDPKPPIFQRVYEDEDCISIWKYNLNKFKNGPIEVENKYKRGYKHPSMNEKKFLKDFILEEKKKLRSK